MQVVFFKWRTNVINIKIKDQPYIFVYNPIAWPKRSQSSIILWTLSEPRIYVIFVLLKELYLLA